MKDTVMRFRAPLLFFAGLLAAAPTSFTALAPFAFVFFIPALLLLFPDYLKPALPHKPRRYYGLGLCFSMGYFMMTLHWFLSMWPLDFVNGMTRLGAVGVIFAACVGLPFLQSVGFAFLFYLLAQLARTRALRRYPLALPFAFAVGWTFFAFTQTLTFAGVPWGAQLALSQHENLLLVSSASFFGSFFVTFVIAAVNALLAFGILRFFAGEKKVGRLCAALAAGIFLLNFALSSLAYLLPVREGEKTNAAVLQGNFSSAEKWKNDVDMLETYATLAREAAAEGATLILWPETAIPYGLTNDTYAKPFLSRLAEETGATQVVGAYSYEPGEDGERVRHNSLFLFRPDGSVSKQLYHKRHLVPFGEYVPMAWLVDTLFPVLGSLEMLNDGSRVTAGDDPALFEEDWGTLGGLICFDSIYPALARDSAAAGAELLLISTNDSWFFDSRAVYQHNGQAILRAIENGRYVLRSANTGISSIITAKGEVIDDIPALTRGQLTAEVSLIEGNTLYTQIGDLFVLLAAVAFHLPFAVELYCRIREKQKKV